MQYIVVLAFTILLDIIQLGLYFRDNQDANGSGSSELLHQCMHSKILSLPSQLKPSVLGSFLQRILIIVLCMHASNIDRCNTFP